MNQNPTHGGFLWPHLAKFLSLRSSHPAQSEFRHLTLDSAFGGAWVALMQFNLLPSVLLVTMLSVDKIAVGASGAGVIDLRKSPTQNLRAIADRKGVYVEDLTVIILNRPRHEKLIAEVRSSGARIKLIGDGDVSAAIATCFIETGVDVLMGIGGAPEGVIAAAALRCCGGDMQGKLAFRNEKEIERARKMGIGDPNKIYTVEEMAKGPVLFAATGVTSGDFLKGVRFFKGGAATQSVVMRSKSHTIRYLETTHFFEHKPNFAL